MRAAGTRWAERHDLSKVQRQGGGALDDLGRVASEEIEPVDNLVVLGPLVGRDALAKVEQVCRTTGSAIKAASTITAALTVDPEPAREFFPAVAG